MMHDLSCVINNQEKLHSFYIRNPEVAAEYITQHLKGRKLLLYSTGLHSAQILSLCKDRISAAVREGGTDETYEEHIKDFPVIREEELINTDFDLLLLPGDWTSEKAAELAQKLSVPHEKICRIYYTPQCQRMLVNSFYKELPGDRKIFFHLVWDAKNDLISEAAEKLSGHFYTIKIYLSGFHFYHRFDNFFNQTHNISGMTVDMRLRFIISSLMHIKPAAVAVGKPTPFETEFVTAVLENKPEETSFFFSPIGDIFAYKSSSLTHEELAAGTGLSVSDIKEIYCAEQKLIRESDGVITNLFGPYKQQVLDKEAKSSISSYFFMHPSFFIFKNRKLSEKPQIVYTGSLDYSSDEKNIWAYVMSFYDIFISMLAGGMSLQVITFDHQGLNRYRSLAETDKNFKLVLNASHWELPEMISGNDFGLICPNMPPSVIKKLFPSSESVFLAKLITYLSAGIPVIVTRESKLLADFVSEHQIGITLPLSGISGLNRLISECDYQLLKENVRLFKDKYTEAAHDKTLVNYILKQVK